MLHSLSKDTAFTGETAPRHTFLCSDSQCLPPGDPRILCAKHGYPITGKSFIHLLSKCLRCAPFQFYTFSECFKLLEIKHIPYIFIFLEKAEWLSRLKKAMKMKGYNYIYKADEQWLPFILLLTIVLPISCDSSLSKEEWWYWII